MIKCKALYSIGSIFGYHENWKLAPLSIIGCIFDSRRIDMLYLPGDSTHTPTNKPAQIGHLASKHTNGGSAKQTSPQPGPFSPPPSPWTSISRYLEG